MKSYDFRSACRLNIKDDISFRKKRNSSGLSLTSGVDSADHNHAKEVLCREPITSAPVSIDKYFRIAGTNMPLTLKYVHKPAHNNHDKYVCNINIRPRFRMMIWTTGFPESDRNWVIVYAVMMIKIRFIIIFQLSSHIKNPKNFRPPIGGQYYIVLQYNI